MPGIHHVYARGNDRRAVFRDDVDRMSYVLLLGHTVQRMRWRCLSYCLMDNHVHLLVELADATLPAGVQRLHGLYARMFNDRYARAGHVFQGRYGSTVVTSDEQLWWTVAYIVRNPVEAGLCRSPEDWRWSSHAAVLQGTAPPWLDAARLLQSFEAVGGDPLRRYVELSEGEPRAA